MKNARANLGNLLAFYFGEGYDLHNLRLTGAVCHKVPGKPVVIGSAVMDSTERRRRNAKRLARRRDRSTCRQLLDQRRRDPDAPGRDHRRKRKSGRNGKHTGVCRNRGVHQGNGPCKVRPGGRWRHPVPSCRISKIDHKPCGGKTCCMAFFFYEGKAASCRIAER